MNYTVNFKLKQSFFWKTYKNVKADLVSTDLGTPMRVLILDDESRVEIPLDGTQFKFCSKRFLAIKKQMEQEAGQTLPIRSSI